jgi:hypothetical protein
MSDGDKRSNVKGEIRSDVRGRYEVMYRGGIRSDVRWRVVE